MRGYFAFGVEGVSKPGNLGNLIRTAHGFGAAFVFAIDPKFTAGDGPTAHKTFADTSKSAGHIPYYEYSSIDELALPRGCQLVGVEITDDALEMPSFRHPLRAAYILGSERYSLSAEIIGKCDHIIKIPTNFSLNLATAGAIVMYDRLLCYGRFAERPVSPSGDVSPLPAHVRGKPATRRGKNKKRQES